MSECKTCGRPVGDQAYICARCTERLAHDLGDVTALRQEIDTTRLRQSRTGGVGIGVISRTFEKPLPWDQNAAEAAELLQSTLVSWCRLVQEDRGGPGALPDRESHYLLNNLEWLRHQSFADEALDELTHAVGRVRVAIDTRPALAYAGPCRTDRPADDDRGETCCVADLYGPTGLERVRCRECGAVHDMDERRTWLLSVVEDQLAHAGLLSAAVSRLGQTVTSAMIRGYAFRQRLVPHGLDHKGRPLYRVGDLLEILRNDAHKKGRGAA